MAAAPAPIRPAVFKDVPAITAGFSTRHGGVSEPPYDTLNLGLSTEDAEANVEENRRRLPAPLGAAPDQLALAGQVHGDRVKGVVGPGLYEGYDALVTRTPGVLLGIVAADCAAVLLAGPGAGIVGACHAGWRGTAARVVIKTVKAMQRAGADPAHIRTYVSPCISAEHFEVGEEVAAQFKKSFIRRGYSGAKPHVDLKAAIAEQLRQGGVPEAQIEVSDCCTFAESDDFFSHRASGGTTGRMLGFIGLVGETESR